MRIIENIYYRIYRLLLQIKTNENPKENAIFVFGIILIWNIITVHLLASAAGIVSAKKIPTYLYLLVNLGVVALLYFYINRKFQKIIEHYYHESSSNRAFNVFLFIVYLVGSILSSVFAVIYFG